MRRLGGDGRPRAAPPTASERAAGSGPPGAADPLGAAVPPVMATSDAETGLLPLDQAARDLLLPEIEALLAEVRGSEARLRFARLARAVAAGRVEPEEMPALEQVLRLGIETGRFERVHGRAADTLARGLYGRTPAGRASAAQAAEVTAALAAFAGAELRALAVATDGPGGYRLTLETDRGEALVRIDRNGVRLDSVQV